MGAKGREKAKTGNEMEGREAQQEEDMSGNNRERARKGRERGQTNIWDGKKRRKTKRSKKNVPGWSGAPDQTIIKNKRLDKVSRNASE